MQHEESKARVLGGQVGCAAQLRPGLSDGPGPVSSHPPLCSRTRTARTPMGIKRCVIPVLLARL